MGYGVNMRTFCAHLPLAILRDWCRKSMRLSVFDI